MHGHPPGPPVPRTERFRGHVGLFRAAWTAGLHPIQNLSGVRRCRSSGKNLATVFEVLRSNKR